MFNYVNVCYVSMLVVVTKDVVEYPDVVLAAIAALELRMLVCNTILLCPNSLMFVMFPCVLLLLRMLWRILMLF